MNSARKQISNPFATGGGGENFETRVQALFVVLMLTGGVLPCFSGCPINKIKLQGRCSGYEIDDVIIFVEKPGERRERKLLGQIKHSITITEGDNVFADVIQAAWNDFNNPEIFTREKDLIALITGPLSLTDTSDVRTILEWARSCENLEEFFRNVEMTKFSSHAKRSKLQAFRAQLKKANGGKDVADEEFFIFLKHFYVLSYDLDIKNGVTLSLLHSLIGQYSHENTHNIWPRIIDEVQSANQNAGTITIDLLSDDIKEAFKKRVYETIPPDFTRTLIVGTKLDWSHHEYASNLAIANLLGSWNENIEADITIAEQLAQENYAIWIPQMRELLLQIESPITLKNGVWTITERQELLQILGPRLFDGDLNIFKQCVTTVLAEHDPQFELPPEQRYAAGIHGKTLKYSRYLRKGLSESLALLGSYPALLSNCSTGKSEVAVVSTIRDIFSNSDWVLWGSLNNLLPLLAEAAPNEFMSAVEIALQQTPCPFDNLFEQEGKGIMGGNYLTGLLWALETLAWDDQYLIRVSVILGELTSHDPGGKWSNRPSNSLTTIFLPWLPQTTAPIEKRKVAIQTLQKENPKAAWELLLSLLPNHNQISSGSCKPTWRKIIPENWSEEATQAEYWEQVGLYADMTVEMADNDVIKLEELSDHLDNLPKPSLDKILEHLSSEDIIGKPENERVALWTSLKDFIAKHERFANAKSALGSELIAKIIEITRKLAPQNRLYLHQRLFIERDMDLYEEKGDWQEQQKKLEDSRQLAIKEILDIDGSEGVVRFASMVESPWKVGISSGLLASPGLDSVVIPDLLEVGSKKLKQFASGFVWGRYHSQGWAWIDTTNMSKWLHSQIGQFLAYLPFTSETWKRSKELLGEFEGIYWTRVSVNPYQVDSELYVAIDKLIEYGRSNSAIICLYKNLHDKQPLDQTRTTKALLSAVPLKEPLSSMDTYYIIDIIKAMQNDPNTDPQDLFNVEWAYLPLLERDRDASPKSLENRLAADPYFFCEVIRRVYRSKKDPKPEQEPTEQQKAVATNAYRLLREWRTPPGLQPDGIFSKEQLMIWLESTKATCTESGHIKVALTHVGHVLAHCPPDPEGLWINRTAAEVLNAKDAATIRDGFVTEILNSRGMHFVDPNGKAEMELSEKYIKQAVDAENAGYHRLALSLRQLAGWYVNEANRIIDDYKKEQDDDS